MPAIAAALFARFTSRQDDSPAMKAVAAMRNQFGGHAMKTEAPATSADAQGPAGGTSAGSPDQSAAAESAGAGGDRAGG
jgi:6-phosphogluconate dehydrogenase